MPAEIIAETTGMAAEAADPSWSANDEVPEAGQSRGHPTRLAALAAVVLTLGLLGGLPLLAVIFAIVFMIFMHELGHYLTARAAGMKVTEYFIGFGPRIWSFRRGETEYGLKAIPAGAYVRIIGMNNLDVVDPADESRTYRQKSYPRRMSVAFAGSAMHFLMAFVLAFIALVGFGEVTDESEQAWTVGQLSSPDDIEANADGRLGGALAAQLADGATPASAAGLQPGDRLLAADGEELELFTDLRFVVESHPGETVTFTVERDDETFEVPVLIGSVGTGDERVGVIGVQPEIPREQLGVFEGVQRSFSTFGEITVGSLQGLGRFFSPSGLSDFADVVFSANDDGGGGEGSDEPAQGSGSGSSEDENRIISIYGATRIGAQATEADGAVALIRFMVLLNIFIGIFNLVPLLPLDGGHVAVGTYERIREIGRRGRYHADIAKLLPLTYGVVVFLVTIGVMALYADIANPVNVQ